MTFPVALQAFTIREELKRDYFGTLARVAEIGYQGVELGTPPAGTTTGELKDFLDRHGLKFVATHVWLEQLVGDCETEIAYAQEARVPYLVASCPVRSRSHVLELARFCNRVGETCRAQGIQLLYHNHDWELATYDGERGLDMLLAATDPELVRMELDTYWVQRGGGDPAAYLRMLHGRCPLLHIKDMEPGDGQFFAEIGEGILDFPTIFQAAETAGTRWLVVEQDSSRRSPFESIAISYRNLQTMGVL